MKRRTKKPNTIGYVRSDSRSENSATGLGTATGRNAYTQIAPAELDRAWDSLAAIYDTDGMGARICDALPQWATMHGFKIKTPDVDFDPRPLFSRLEDLELLPQVSRLGTFARMMGGAGLIVHGGGALESPWSEGDQVEALTPADAEILTRDVETLGGPGQIKRGQFVPEFYTLSPIDEGERSQRIHHTRILRMIGADTTPKNRARLDGWGRSSLERPYQAILSLADSLGYASEMLHTASVFILQIDGWLKAIMEGGESAESMREAVAEVFDSVDILHGYAIDKNSDMKEITRSLGGVEPIVRLMVDAVRRNADGIPRTILENEQPTGSLSAGSEGEFASWFARVAAYQREQLTPVVAPIVASVMASMPGSPEEWQIEWCALQTEDAQRESEIAESRSRTATAYHAMGAIEAYEIRDGLIKAGEFEESDPPEFEESERETALAGVEEDPDLGESEEE